MGQDTSMWYYLGKLQVGVCRFWAAVPGSLKNHLNTEELARIMIASLTAGGGLFGLVQAMTLHVGAIFPASGDAALATVVLTMILEAHRRLGQGHEPAPQTDRTRVRS
ncbi:MAG: hypothetical protein LC745_07235 [Planctomycetia bacterium]|nr:hypothetical protein [Planctomycetia bacterium]